MIVPALSNIGRVGAVVGGCNAVGFLLTAALETHKITDLIGAGSFVAATVDLSMKNNLFSNAFSYPKLALINLGVAVWGARLATFLFRRVLQVGEDKRLNKLFRQPGEGYLDPKRSLFPLKLGMFWTIQAAWGFLCLLPVALINAVPATHSSEMARSLLSFEGDSVLFNLIGPVTGIFIGIAVEAVADAQKNAYRSDNRNDGHWCDQGLWKHCRHPNYFGELWTWWSVYFAVLPALLQQPAVLPYAPLIALVSPAFITFLLLKVSGVPILERKHAKEYAGNQEYDRYVRDTPLLVPNFLRAFQATASKPSAKAD